MTCRIGFWFAAIAWMAVACGGGTPNNQDVAVSSSPLSGVVEGVTFTPVSAIAHAESFSDAGMRFVNIYEVASDCSNSFPTVPRGQPQILAHVPWAAGVAYNFGLGQNATFVWTDDAGTSQNFISLDGRIEIISAPQDAGSMGTLRIRANYDANNHVEGQVSVLACD